MIQRPADKRKTHGKSMRYFVRYISDEEKDRWYAAIDAIRQARVPKPNKRIAIFEASAAEVMEEFA